MKPKKNKARKGHATAAAKRSVAHRDSEGRVHLRLHHDPTSGAHYLTLEAPVFKEEWQNEIALATANTAHGILRDAPSLTRALELAKSAMAATSRLAEGLLARAPEGSVACKAGCDHCCYQSVGVTAPEALAILDHLKRTLSELELAKVTAHVAEAYEKTRALSAAQRFSPEHPCPFLRVETARCTIYEVRPLSCRGMNSLDAGECATRLREPEARSEFLAKGRSGRSFMEPIRAFHAISAGLQLSLSELYRLDMRPLELTAALFLLLTGPESSPREWIGGQTPFVAAIRSDNSTDPGLRDLSGALELVPGQDE
jgi:Fe-S-cluster containining protein